MKKVQKIELELMAIKLWFQSFGMPNMSSDNDRAYMSKKLNKLKKDLNNTEYFSLLKSKQWQ
jgi:hypothetical protein